MTIIFTLPQAAPMLLSCSFTVLSDKAQRRLPEGFGRKEVIGDDEGDGEFNLDCCREKERVFSGWKSAEEV